MPTLFDMELRALRRDRAARLQPELFLLDRAFDDCLERISLVQRQFERALLIGCPSSDWPSRMRPLARRVDVREPGAIFAREAGGEQLIEDGWEPEHSAYDLVLAVGTLDTVNDLPRALLAIRWAMQPECLFIGALSGGDTLPRLRGAMRAADAVSGVASPHVHPRIEAAALAPLLAQAGFADPVVDIDRVAVSYTSLGKLVSDLRRMGATNLLSARSRHPLSKQGYSAAARDFSAPDDGKTLETFEILHFAGWSRADRRQEETG